MTVAEMVAMFGQGALVWAAPVQALEPLRIANQYGLFAVMTPHRYEIEFQGSNDGKTWTRLDDGNWNALSLPFVVGPEGRIARLSASEKK